MLEGLRDLDPGVLVALALSFGVAVLASVLALIIVVTGRRGRVARIVGSIAPGATSMLVLAIVWGVANARQLLTGIVRGEIGTDPATRSMLLAMSISRQLHGLIWGELAFCGALPFSLMGAFAWLMASHESADRRRLGALILATHLALGGAALCSLGYETQLIRGFSVLAMVDRAHKGDMLRRAVAEAEGSVAGISIAVAVLIGVGALVGLAAAGRAGARRIAPKAIDWIFAAAMLTVGACAYGFTRGHAYDADHPVGRRPFPAYPPQSDPESLPQESTACAQVRFAPILFVDHEHAELSGRAVVVGELGSRLKSPMERRRAEHPTEPFADEVILDSVAEAPIGTVIPWLWGLWGVRDAGVSKVTVLYSSETQTLTRTLGALRVRAFCARTFSIADTGKPLESFATWGDLAADVGARSVYALPGVRCLLPEGCDNTPVMGSPDPNVPMSHP